MNIGDVEPIIVEPFETATFFYNAETNEIGFSHWRVVGGETDPTDFATHRAILKFLLARIDEHEAAEIKAAAGKT